MANRTEGNWVTKARCSIIAVVAGADCCGVTIVCMHRSVGVIGRGVAVIVAIQIKRIRAVRTAPPKPQPQPPINRKSKGAAAVRNQKVHCDMNHRNRWHLRRHRPHPRPHRPPQRHPLRPPHRSEQSSRMPRERVRGRSVSIIQMPPHQQ